MSSREWAWALLAAAGALIAGGLILGLTPATVGSGINASSCGSPWMPNYQAPTSGDTSGTLANMTACATAFGNRSQLAELPIVLGVLTLVGTGMVKMVLAGRREAQAAADTSNKPAAS
jgi:hypothetical protein